MKNVQELIDILSLEDLGNHTFLGVSKNIGSPRVFGGQVLAQALNAAYRTILGGRIVHSLHSYFLLPGDLEIPITYKVNEMRNGGSFSTRRVTAIQNGETIFIMAASFHKTESGHNHQEPIKKEIKQPEELLNWTDILDKYRSFMPKAMQDFLSIERPIDFKPLEIPNLLIKENLPAMEDVWFQLKGDASNLPLPLKQQILTYISDYNILNPTLKPHPKAHYGNTQMASLDHSMWFYRDFTFNDWMLYSMLSPSASGARGFASGNMFTRSGTLVASVAQEGLIRPMEK